MSHTAIALHDLEQRINQRQAELEQLRREYEVRQGQLQKLTQRQQQLQAQLHQVEAEIAALDHGKASPTKPGKATKPATAKTKAAPATPSNGAVAPLSLPKLLVQIVGEAKRPVTLKELVGEVVRRHYPSTSKRLPKMVEARVSELVKKGLLRRAPNQAGVLPGGKPAPTKAPSPAKAGASKPAAAAPAAPAPSVAARELTLAAAITKVLAASAKPLTARELADKVLVLGYQSKSKDFLNVIGASMSKMDNVEHVKGQGYRLKKGKTSAAANKGKNSK